MRTRRSLAKAWQGRSRSCALSSRATLMMIPLCRRVAPVIATIWPSRYSFFVSARRSSLRYSWTLSRFGSAAIVLLSGQQVRHRDHRLGPGERGDGVPCPQDEPGAVCLPRRVTGDLQGLVPEVQDPAFGNPVQSVDGHLHPLVMEQRLVGDFDHEESRGGMGMGVIARNACNNGNIGLRLR